MVEQSDCGATTAWGVGAELVPVPWSLLGHKTQLFSMALDHDGIESWGQGHPDVDAIWASNEHLIIRHTRGRIATQESSVQGIRVSYEELQ